MPGQIRLPSSTDDALHSQSRSSALRWTACAVIVAGLVGLFASPVEVLDFLPVFPTASKHGHLPRCPPQVEPLVPKRTFEAASKDEYAERLAQAVRIPTISYDDNGKPDEDVRNP